MTLCHDVINEQTYYAQYRLTPANVAAQHGIKRPSFIQSNFFPDKDVNLLYGREHQRKIISEFIGSDVLLSMDASNVYLSRGNTNGYLFTQILYLRSMEFLRFRLLMLITFFFVLRPIPIYLHLGHLAAKGDFIYGNEQRATFYYINAAPQVGKRIFSGILLRKWCHVSLKLKHFEICHWILAQRTLRD